MDLANTRKALEKKVLKSCIVHQKKHKNIPKLRLGFLQTNWSHKIGIKKISRSSYIHSSICTEAAKHVGRRPWHRARFQSSPPMLTNLQAPLEFF